MNKLSPQEIHDLKGFYAFFDLIPEEKWCQGSYGLSDGRKCALGHLGRTSSYHSEKSRIFIKLFEKFNLNVPKINDSLNGHPETNILQVISTILQSETH